VEPVARANEKRVSPLRITYTGQKVLRMHGVGLGRTGDVTVSVDVCVGVGLDV